MNRKKSSLPGFVYYRIEKLMEMLNNPHKQKQFGDTEWPKCVLIIELGLRLNNKRLSPKTRELAENTLQNIMFSKSEEEQHRLFAWDALHSSDRELLSLNAKTSLLQFIKENPKLSISQETTSEYDDSEN